MSRENEANPEFAALMEKLALRPAPRSAAVELDAFIKRKYASWVVARTSRDVADDILQRVTIDVYLRRQDGKPIESQSYISRMVANRLHDHGRQLKRETRAGLRSLAAQKNEEGEDIEAREIPQLGLSGDLTIEYATSIYQRIVEHAVANRVKRWREDLRRDTDQLWRMAAGETELDEALAEDGEIESAADRKAAQARMHKRHQRAREKLGEALGELTERRELTATEADFAHLMMAKLLRIGRESAPVSVIGQDSEPSVGQDQ